MAVSEGPREALKGDIVAGKDVCKALSSSGATSEDAFKKWTYDIGKKNGETELRPQRRWRMCTLHRGRLKTQTSYLKDKMCSSLELLQKKVNTD